MTDLDRSGIKHALDSATKDRDEAVRQCQNLAVAAVDSSCRESALTKDRDAWRALAIELGTNLGFSVSTHGERCSEPCADLERQRSVLKKLNQMRGDVK